MKDVLLGILILAVLLVVFSRVDTRIEYEYPFGNWHIYGDSGEVIPGEGEQGDADVFSFGEPKEEQKPRPVPGEDAAVSEYCPITVEVITKESPKSTNLTPIHQVLYKLIAVLSVILAVVVTIDVILLVEYISINKIQNGVLP